MAANSPVGRVDEEGYRCTGTDWYNGETTMDPATGRIVSLFKCAKQIVVDGYDAYVLPAGATVYHGSARLTQALVEFPIGEAFYAGSSGARSGKRPEGEQGRNGFEPRQLSIVAKTQNSIETQLAELEKVGISPSWYSDPRIAHIYGKTKCPQGMTCIFAYSLRRDVTLLRLDSERNIDRLFERVNDPWLESLEKMMGVAKNSFSTDEGRFITTEPSGATRKGFARKSGRKRDMHFAQWFCHNMTSKFDGYASDAIEAGFMKRGGTERFAYSYTARSPIEEKFHPEIVFCNAFSVLERAYANSIDWQHQPFESYPPYVVRFMEQLFLYKTINTGFHSGNLYQHSVWTLLAAENYDRQLAKIIDVSSDSLSKLAVFTAFIHDIGKMVPDRIGADGQQEVLYAAFDNNFVYYEVKEHPALGATFVMQDEGPEERDEETDISEIKGELHMSELADAMGVEWNDEDRRIAACVILLHRMFGSDVIAPLDRRSDPTTPAALDVEGPVDKELRSKLISQYVDRALTTYRQTFRGTEPLGMMYVLLVVSVADIQATQPIGMEDGTNARSTFFPYIRNVSKNYPGVRLNVDLANKTARMVLVEVAKRLRE